METPQKEEQATSSKDFSVTGKIEEYYKKTRQSIEDYPYVWASYTLVYGGLSMWAAYRWRKLRKTENRVKILQERLRKLVESEEAAKSVAASSVDKASSSSTIQKSTK